MILEELKLEVCTSRLEYGGIWLVEFSLIQGVKQRHGTCHGEHLQRSRRQIISIGNLKL